MLSGGSLHLKSLPYQIERENTYLRSHTCQHSRSSIAGPEWELEFRKRWPQSLVSAEEQAHVWHDLRNARAEALEESRQTFVAIDSAY